MVAPRHPLLLRRLAMTIVFVALLLTSFTTTMDAATAAAPQRTAIDPGDGWTSAACPVAVPSADRSRVTCGYITVPERRGEAGDPERTVRLPVAIIASRADRPLPDPLVVPTMGAGTFSGLGYWLHQADWVADTRDIVLVEQRGDLESEPTLDCPELDAGELIVDGEVRVFDTDLRLQRLTACHDRLVADGEDGVDLAGFTSTESATDLARVREVLRYVPWNLYGVGEGSRLALTVMRDRPEGLRSVILDGVSPPNVVRYESTAAGFVDAIDALVAACNDDVDCGERYPDLRAQLADVLERLADEPLDLEVRVPERSPARLSLTDTGLVDGLILALQDPATVRMLPFVIDQLASGNAAAALPLAQAMFDASDDAAEGLERSLACAEQVPSVDDGRLADSLTNDPLLAHYDPAPGMRESCEVWAVPALGDAETTAVTSGIPSLLLSGGFDPVTPASWAETAAATLSTQYSFVFPNLSHGVVLQNAIDGCAAAIAGRFLDDPAEAPSARCAELGEPVDFVTTADIDPLPGVYGIERDLVQDRQPVQVAILGLLVALLSSALVYTIVCGAHALARRPVPAPGGTVLAAGTAVALDLAYVGSMGLLVVAGDRDTLAYGLPTAAWPILLLPWLALAAAVLLIVLLVRAWIADDGTMGHRVTLSLIAVVCLGFAGWLLAHGLLTL